MDEGEPAVADAPVDAMEMLKWDDEDMLLVVWDANPAFLFG